jgi:hypothetical protein
MEESSYGLIIGTNPVSVCRKSCKPQKTSIRIVADLANEEPEVLQCLI